MPIQVPYLREEQIERDAEILLAEYERARDAKIQRAVPIEDIAERYLKLGIEFDDMHVRLGVPRPDPGSAANILGAIYFDDQRVVIDESLDPEGNPNMEGRYRFTLAHEAGGHWRLHRHLFAKCPGQESFFNQPAPPSVVCRSHRAKESVEWQADFYASCLLMPRNLVRAAWNERFPDRRPRVISPDVPVEHSFVEIKRFECRIPGLEFTESVEEAMDRFARPLAEQFQVSPIAMRIRLEKLGLLHRVVPEQRNIASRI